VLTNQCLGIEKNAEPPGRGTEKSLLRLADSDKLIVERHWDRTPPFAQLRLWLHNNRSWKNAAKEHETWPQVDIFWRATALRQSVSSQIYLRLNKLLAAPSRTQKLKSQA
jgi:hypothetical protein